MPHPSHQHRQQRHDRDLRRKRLGRRHADLRPGVHVRAAIDLAGDGRADDVDDGEGLVPFAPRFAHRRQRIDGFTRLADGEHERVLLHGGVAVAEFAGVIALGRDAREFLHQVLAHHRRVQGRAAGDVDDAVHRAQFGRRDVQAAETRRRFLVADAAAESVLHGARLLENLLEHVVRELPALDLFRREFNLANLRADRRRLDGGHLEIIAGERDDLEVIQVHDAARVGDNRADVAGEKVFVAADAEEQGTAAARADNLVGMIRMKDGDTVGADDVLERAAHGFRERGTVAAGMLGVDLFVMVADEMRENFRVRLRRELVSLGQQAFLQKLVVLDNAVVDEGNLAGLVEVRVGIGIGRRAVRRPAGMADADVAFGGLFGKEGGQIIDAAGLLAELELLIINDAETGGIVTAVLEPAQAFEDDVLGGFPANVADDATHGAFLV